MHKSILAVATIAAALSMWGCGGQEETSSIPSEAADTAKGVVDDVADVVEDVKDEAEEATE